MAHDAVQEAQKCLIYGQPVRGTEIWLLRDVFQSVTVTIVAAVSMTLFIFVLRSVILYTAVMMHR